MDSILTRGELLPDDVIRTNVCRALNKVVRMSLTCAKRSGSIQSAPSTNLKKFLVEASA